jgi:hypothetical protein
LQDSLQSAEAPPWLRNAAARLTPRRIRAHATIFTLCLWGICAIDFATSGLFDRQGNIKFQDFLPTYISARLIANGRAAQLYNQAAVADEVQAVVGPTNVRLPNFYGPQVGLLFVPLSRFSFPVAARIWVTASLLLYFGCIYLVWKSCPALRLYPGLVALCALAFPPLFHFFVRGQNSALVLAFFTAAFLAFRGERNFLAGVALGFLIFKPQFLVAIPLVLLLARIYFGPVVMRAYFETLLHISRVIDAAELSLAPAQMHSLRSFWSLLIPWPGIANEVAFALYALSSVAIIAIAAFTWKSSAPLVLRFPALTLAAILVNPHLFIYDLLVLAPALLLLVDWTLNNPQRVVAPALRLLLYLAFVLPLFGPLAQWIRIQLSVPVFAILLWMLWREASRDKVASSESGVV